MYFSPSPDFHYIQFDILPINKWGEEPAVYLLLEDIYL